MTEEYRIDVHNLTRKTLEGEAEWAYGEEGGSFVLDRGTCGSIHLSPVITGLILAEQPPGQSVVVPAMYGDVLHPGDFQLLLTLAFAIVGRLEEGLRAHMRRQGLSAA